MNFFRGRFLIAILLFSVISPVRDLANKTFYRQDFESIDLQAISPDPSVLAVVNQANADTLELYTRQLAGVDPIWIDDAWYYVPNRYTYSQQPIDKVTRYVGQHLLSLGQTVDYHIWDNVNNPNVIGEIGGTTHPENIYIIGGHLDGVGGSVAADDNGSGAAATLMIADILSQYQWGCTLRFVFWTGEEQWLLGSRPYAQRSNALNENILGYINLDMIGYNSEGSSSGVDIIYNENIAQTLLDANTFVETVNAYQFQIEPEIMSDLSADSDHYSFWENGFPAILVMENQADWNPYYHTTNDTIDHVDYNYLTEITKASLATFLHMNNCLLSSTVLSTTGSTLTEIRLGWTDGSTDESDFHVERSPNGISEWVEIATAGANATSYTDTGLTCGTVAYYRIRAHWHPDNRFSSYSNIVNATTSTCSPPNAPTGLSASAASQTLINLSWIDNSTDESDFHIERSPDGLSNWTEIATVGANTTTFNNSGLACGSAFYYRVRAQRHSDNAYSSYSNTEHATTVLCPLQAPSGLSASADSQTLINLSWIDNSTDESDFHIERSPDGLSDWTEIATVGANTTTFNNSGLACGSAFYYRVRAQRHSDNAYSSYSNTEHATTVLCPLQAPSGLSASADSQTLINLSWIDNSTDESDFHIERSPDGLSDWIEIATVGANTTTFNNSGLACGSAFYYRVRTQRHSDNAYSSYSNTAHATTVLCPLQAPSGLSASAPSQTLINLSWIDNSTDESDFHIERSPDGLSDWTEIATVGANTTTFNNSGLTCGSAFYYRVRAQRHSDSDYSSYSNIATTSTKVCQQPLACPSNLVVTEIWPTALQLTWVDNSSDESAFRVERFNGVAFIWEEVSVLPENSISYQNSEFLGEGQMFRVRAYREIDYVFSDYSNTVTYVPDQHLAPSAPTELESQVILPDRIELHWTDNASDETAFYLEQSLDGETNWIPIKILAPNTTTTHVEGLPGETYYFRIRAFRSPDQIYSGYSNLTVASLPLPWLKVYLPYIVR